MKANFAGITSSIQVSAELLSKSDSSSSVVPTRFRRLILASPPLTFPCALVAPVRPCDGFSLSSRGCGVAGTLRGDDVAW